jgi:hypothetical protein
MRYDDLVRAPIPVLVSVNCSVRIPKGAAFSVQAAQQVVADRINNLGFSSGLSSSYVIDALHGVINSGYVITPVDMIGELISPADGSSVLLRSSSLLQVTTDYEQSISARTVMFFCDPANVNVYVEVQA